MVTENYNDEWEKVYNKVSENCWRLMHFEEKYKNDKKIVIVAVQKDGNVLEFAGDKLKADKEVVLEAVRNNGCALKYASEILKDDKDVVLEAVRKSACSFMYASDGLKDDKEVVLEAVRRYRWNLMYASERLKEDDELIALSVDESFWTKKKYFKDGIVEFKRGNYQLAKEEFENRKRSFTSCGLYGDSTIDCPYLAFMYYYGIGTKVDYEKAWKELHYIGYMRRSLFL